MDIYFMRHGETDYNRRGLIQGRADIPLNEDGIAQAKEIAQYFRDRGIHFDKVYSSPLIRARQTASMAAGIEMDELNIDERIKELSFGIHEGKEIVTLPEEFTNLFTKPEAFVVPEDGESIEQLSERCQSFLDDLALLPEREPDVHTVLVTSHGAALRGILRCLEKTPIEKFWRRGFTNCAYIHAQLENGVYTVKELVQPLRESEEVRISKMKFKNLNKRL